MKRNPFIPLLRRPTVADTKRMLGDVYHEPWGQLASNKAWTALCDANTIAEVITGEMVPEGFDSVIVADTYWLLYAVGKPWYSTKPILSEELLWRLYENGPGRFADVIEALDALAEQHGAYGISTGTALAGKDSALSRMYERQGGYRPVTTGMFKEIKR